MTLFWHMCSLILKNVVLYQDVIEIEVFFSISMKDIYHAVSKTHRVGYYGSGSGSGPQLFSPDQTKCLIMLGGGQLTPNS